MTDATDDWEYDETEERAEDEAEPPLAYEIMNYPADTTLQGYVDMWDRKELTIPDFQRAYVWDQVRASKLIESFLLGLPVPGVFLFKPREKPTYLIVDGQQRIKSVIAYIKGEFKERTFRLKNVAPKWNGRRFTELSDEEKFKLTGSVMRATIIQQINPADHTSIYQIFERLNTGGVNLSPMEIRQCVSYGPFIAHLKELNSNPNWRRIIGKSEPDSRLRDVELVLRCLALHGDSEDYEKPMKGFLNAFAEKQREEPTNYEESKQAFERVCEHVVSELGEKPFHLRGRLNYGLLDSIVVTILDLGPVSGLKEKFNELSKNQDFLNAITKNTSDAEEVKTRLRIACEFLSDR